MRDVRLQAKSPTCGDVTGVMVDETRSLLRMS